ncbi:MAG: hypothetical protein JWM88_2674 [Verrucomicrobia bacterium]|nr:hypothetical protein [Verrucomicrobiota bacterium]
MFHREDREGREDRSEMPVARFRPFAPLAFFAVNDPGPGNKKASPVTGSLEGYAAIAAQLAAGAGAGAAAGAATRFSRALTATAALPVRWRR